MQKIFDDLKTIGAIKLPKIFMRKLTVNIHARLGSEENGVCGLPEFLSMSS